MAGGNDLARRSSAMKIRIPRFEDLGAAQRESMQLPDLEPEKVIIQVELNRLPAMLAEVATNAWKARMRLTASPNTESQQEQKRLLRNVEAILGSLQEFGIEVKDHTGESYDYGQALKVVAAQPTNGIEREVVTETIRPSVFWKDYLIQRGEVVIATPKSEEG
jgi:hypothetical protein